MFFVCARLTTVTTTTFYFAQMAKLIVYFLFLLVWVVASLATNNAAPHPIIPIIDIAPLILQASGKVVEVRKISDIISSLLNALETEG